LRLPTVIVLADPMNFSENLDRSQQCSSESSIREVVKAYSGYSLPNNVLSREFHHIATGNWYILILIHRALSLTILTHGSSFFPGVVWSSILSGARVFGGVWLTIT
jgi:hypothetical protein